MAADHITTDLAALIRPEQALAYAKATGWVQAHTKRDGIAVLERPDQEQRFDQLIVPSDRMLDDFAARMADVVTRLSKYQDRPAVQVLNELLAPPSDVLRFRIDDPVAEDGTVPFEEGFELIKGVRRSLQAAACSVLAASKFHSRLSRHESDLLVQGARMGQTERGSFVALIILPLDAVPDDDDDPRQMSMFPDDWKTPFVRKTTSHLMQAVAHIAQSLDQGHPEEIESPTDDGIQVSANLCDALLEMRPPSERSTLQIAAAWAPTLPALATVPSAVEVRREWYPEIERYAAQLRPHQEPAPDRFIALVASLMGKANEKGQMAGDVTLQFQYEEELLRAKINLGPGDYQIACDAHKQHSYVSVEGILVRRARVHQIEEYSNFDHLHGGEKKKHPL